MIYLDAAATGLQKPEQVYAAADRAMRTMASPGRGGYPAAMDAAETVYACRREAAALLGVADADHVILTGSATHSLNLAIHSRVRPGDRVVISGYEHNAVVRPLFALGAKLDPAVSPLFDRKAAAEAFAGRLRGAAAAVCTQVSNVFGFALPVEEIAALCREAGVPLIVDASQGAGTLPVDAGLWQADFVAMPGHKGLLGPQGTGLLLCGDDRVTPLLCGGTGSQSAEAAMPDFLPDALEPGTHNVPGAAGLTAGLRYVRRRGTADILAHERALARRMIEGLRRLPGCQVFAGEDPESQTGVVSAVFPPLPCETVAEMLAARGIAVRAGLHCAPLAHRTAGTLAAGTVRFSFSPFSTADQVDITLEALVRILREKNEK